MKRMKMQEVRNELNREIKAVSDLQNQAFKNADYDDFFRLGERLNGLFYTHSLINGDTELLGCYQTGLNRNSGGATYIPSKVIE